MESEEALRSKLEDLQRKFEEYKAQTDEFEACLEQELRAKEESLSTTTQKHEQLQHEFSLVRSKYMKTESEVASLQRDRNSLSSKLRAFLEQKCELEQVNNQWEQSARIMEFSKQDLEDKLYQAEESAIMYKGELDELSTLRETEIQRLKEKVKELSQELHIINAQDDNALKIRELEEALTKALQEQSEFKAKLELSHAEEPPDSTCDSEIDCQTIKVLARVKPAAEKEPCALTVQGNEILVTVKKQRGRVATLEKRNFPFERVLGPESPQEEIFLEVLESLNGLTKGARACILAYGQTGSGKTHTMNGLLQQSLEYLDSLYSGKTMDVRMHCVEIYNEMARDLLGDGKLQKNWKQLSCSAELKLSSDWTSHAGKLLRTATANRVTKFTEGNALSSRSHAIYTLTFIHRGIAGQVQFVDLAGSERLSKSHAQGDVLKETLLINKSLSALQDVIAALENKQSHVPYRNSLLTSVLQSTLGGARSYVTIVLNCSPLESNLPETLCTLALGARLKAVDLTFRLRQSLTDQEVERTLKLLEKERAEKSALLRRIEKLERDVQTYNYATREKDSKINVLKTSTAKRNRDSAEEVKKLRNEALLLKNRHAELTKKLRVLKAQAEDEKQAKAKVLLQLQNKELQIKRVISASPAYARRPPSAPHSPLYIGNSASTPTRIPKPKFIYSLELPS